MSQLPSDCITCLRSSSCKKNMFSHSANLGMLQWFSRGFGRRNYYDNFHRVHWELRRNSHHRSDVRETLKCSTKVARGKNESELGCPLLELLYCPAVTPPLFATNFQEKEGGGGA